MLRVEVEAPFDFELSLRFVCQPPRAAAHLGFIPYLDYRQGRQYRRLLALPSRPILALIANQGTVDRPRLEVKTIPGDLSAAERDEVRKRVAHIVSASTGLAAYYRLAARDPVLRNLAERFHGLKVIRAPSLYECLVSTVLEQQLNFHFASTVKRRLLENFGVMVEHEGRVYRGFPPAERLARLVPTDLRPLQISERKATYLLGIARAVAAGGMMDHEWSALPAEVALERLQLLRGVGRWTAEYVLLRGMGSTDALPADDVGLQKSVGALYDLRGPATALAIRRRWRHLAPWRGYATYYTWFTQWCEV